MSSSGGAHSLNLMNSMHDLIGNESVDTNWSIKWKWIEMIKCAAVSRHISTAFAFECLPIMDSFQKSLSGHSLLSHGVWPLTVSCHCCIKHQQWHTEFKYIQLVRSSNTFTKICVRTHIIYQKSHVHDHSPHCSLVLFRAYLFLTVHRNE